MSRLLDNSETIRNQIESRNLYSLGNEYGTTTQTDKVLNSIRSITNSVNALNKIDNRISALYARIVNPTPIVLIGMRKLADQFAKTAASNAGTYAAQMVNFKNLVDGNKDTKFWVGKDYQITIREDQSTIGKILDKLTGIQRDKNPFTNTSTFRDYLDNTGSGQLSELLKNLNRNKYVTNSKILQDFLNSNKKIGSLIGLNTLLNDKTYLTTYLPTNSRIFESIEQENISIIEKINEVFSDGREYSPNNDDIVKYHGKTTNKRFITKDNENIGEIFEDYTYGFPNSEQLIWGLNGLNFEKNYDNGINPIPQAGDIESVYNIKVGLLKYTSELVNSSRGKLIDITRKRYFDPNNPNNFVGYNGAGIYKHSFDSTKDGIRQHTVLDPYDKFAKAIRFEGNKIYSHGNNNSVIYNTVMPKIHPIRDGNKINNKNMMFSLENLAVNVIKDEVNGFAYLDDEYSTVLPLAEAGPLGGRILWFPPYDVKFREQTTSKLETNNFIGRSEPIYTYNNSERTANLDFKLLIDYPLNILQYRGTSNFHQKVSEFFLFGGVDAMNFTDLAKLQSELAKTNEELSNYNNLDKLNTGNFNDVEYDYYFDNDVPNSSEVLTYDFENNIYENGILDQGEIIDYGLNIKNGDNLTERLTTAIQTYLTPENSNLIDIEINGYASKLNDNTVGYNTQLSSRRIECMYNYFNNLYKSIYGKSIEDNGYKVRKNALGSTFASDEGITIAAVNNKNVKIDRRCIVKLTKSTKVQYRTNQLSQEEQQNKDKLLKQKDELEKKISEKKKFISQYDPNSFKEYTINDKIMQGFEPIEKDVYIPVFHSQTPEDFHRRLTFLQQCMRQGRSIGNTGKNSVFGKQPVCVLRIGDFIHTRIMIETLSIDYSESTWDMNPEGIGMQPMIADVSIQFKIIGGESLAMPISMIQNATTFNYYANSTFLRDGTYATPALVEVLQQSETFGVNTESSVKQELIDLNNERDKRQITRSNIK